ncbi:MAG: 16S rRNA (adenine(1518)-N(6)/adenine(1519)-N(6))-dimethyltransferase [Lysobacterales bacterium CG17_big_fil_post_rev_8_21_14_2_50_64_11]|nr:MAG: 16S rRNA (adenine(1518)-N(6)/adenine(1519)-N(6))-dimethyltransferase [Xanthomonadales bacterium CG17_big_fil_post_rev_8_21_14_2_50_64_11]
MSGLSMPAKKRLGQHFLVDHSVIERILMALAPVAGDRLVEIGPGRGALTLPLLARHGSLCAIEFDRDLIEPLRAAAQPLGALDIISADVLRVDFTALAGTGTIRLVGNLPYNISSPILFHALDHAAAIQDMHFMLQKEVVERMAAAPGSKVYGRLSVMLQALCEVMPLFAIGPQAFRPPPKVDSAVVRLQPKPADQIGIADRALFARVVHDAFGQRRKTLRNALANVCDTEALLRAGIRPELRAEQLPVAAFIALSNSLHREQMA